ncbi:MAG TPA: peptidoglycan-associated lipoprotein Pal [Gemmatimonadaceae bacterium]|nr:peptidoglycan-associated lipoprotein Pal [Gemmatimonadaceae bacterium]
MYRKSLAPAALLAVSTMLSACHHAPQQVAQAPAPAPAPAPTPAPAAPPADHSADSAKAAQERLAQARSTIEERIHFDFDKSDILADDKSILDAKLPILRANPNMRIRIEGNCDDRGSEEYNLALGQRRAAAAKRYLTDFGIDAGRIDIISYGHEKPMCTQDSEDCWSQNRRDEFVIIAGGDNIVSMADRETTLALR